MQLHTIRHLCDICATFVRSFQKNLTHTFPSGQPPKTSRRNGFDGAKRRDGAKREKLLHSYRNADILDNTLILCARGDTPRMHSDQHCAVPEGSVSVHWQHWHHTSGYKSGYCICRLLLASLRATDDPHLLPQHDNNNSRGNSVQELLENTFTKQTIKGQRHPPGHK